MFYQSCLAVCTLQLKRLVSLLFLGTFLLLTACGGGGGSSSSGTPVTGTVTGQFIDAAVAGLSYSCSSGKSGVTDTNGRYTCDQGDTVTFSINGFVIGSATASDVITPDSLTSDTAQALNVAQLLQTLDADGDPSNGISIAQSGTQYDAMATMASDNVSLAQGDFDTTAAAYLGVTNLVDETTAQAHLNDSIASMNFSKADIIAFFAGKTVYPAKPTPAYSEEWVMAADGMSATGTGVDQNGAYGGALTFSYTDTSFTVSSVADGSVTFTVTAITSNYIETDHGKVYYTQDAAYTDAIIAAVAGKKLYPQQIAYSYSEEWAFDVTGASAIVNGVDAGGAYTDHPIVTYSGATFTYISQNPADSNYGIPQTLTVLDVTSNFISLRDSNNVENKVFYSQQDAYANISIDAASINAALAGKTVYPAKPTPAYSEEWVMATDGMSATGTGVDGSGAYGPDTLTFSYTDTSFTVSSAVDSPVTFTVIAITSNYLETDLGKIYYTQDAAYTDAIIAAFAGKKVYPQRPSTDYTMELAFDGAGAVTTITCTESGNDCSGHALTTYSGSTFTLTITDPGASDYGVPYTFTVLDIAPGKMTAIDETGVLGFGAGATIGIFDTQQAAYP